MSVVNTSNAKNVVVANSMIPHHIRMVFFFFFKYLCNFVARSLLLYIFLTSIPSPQEEGCITNWETEYLS